MKIENLGNRVANNFIFPIQNGYVLIDTGYEKHFSIFCRELQKRKIALQDIRYVFLTHAHDDHAGFLNELLKNTQAKVILSEKAIEGLEEVKTRFKVDAQVLLRYSFVK